MRQRCSDKKCRAYYRYGGRGISVCERWEKSFEAFITDVGRRPSPKHSLDRYPNNDGNYEPGNVRWATGIMQVRNRCCAVTVTINGMSKSLREWSDDSGVHFGSLASRYYRGQRGVELLAPVKSSGPIEMTGKRFGRLVVMADSGPGKNGMGRMWLCRCDCGEERVILGGALRAGQYQSCGCGTTRGVDVVGRTHGYLTIIGYAPRKCKNGGSVVVCQCECGEKKEVRLCNFEQTKSCGCLNGRQRKPLTKDIASESIKP